MKKEEKKLETIPEQKKVMVPINDVSVKELLNQAIVNNVPVETLEKLMSMRRELRSEYAKTEFDRSLAGFQGECPTIKKTKEVKTKEGKKAYKYAPIESILEQVKDLLDKYGFSYSTQIITGAGKVKAICIVKHIAGHSENYEMEVPLGNKTQIMSDSQVVAAASTFAKRYAFCNAFGILTGDEDVDGADVDVNYETPRANNQYSYPRSNNKYQAAAKTAPAPEIKNLGVLKKEIMKELERIGLNTVDKETIEKDIKFWTGMDLKEENYLKIIESLKSTPPIIQ